MRLGGLVARAALLKEQHNQTPCDRCGLQYDHDKLEKCPHCGDLDEQGLARFLAQREAGLQANRLLGRKFLIATVIVFFILVAVLGH